LSGYIPAYNEHTSKCREAELRQKKRQENTEGDKRPKLGSRTGQKGLNLRTG